MATPQLDSEGFYYVIGGEFPGEKGKNDYALHNADLLWSYFIKTYHWTLPAVCAFFGAITYECGFNPRLIEGGLVTPTRNSGVGYVQWTPSTNLTAYANQWGVPWYLSSTQMRKLELERTTTDSNIRQWFVMNPYKAKYLEDFSEESIYYTQDSFCSTADFVNGNTPRSLSAQIVEFYTRSGSWANKDNWTRNAEMFSFFYERYSGQEPPTPPDTPTPPTPPSKKSGLKVWQMIRYH